MEIEKRELRLYVSELETLLLKGGEKQRKLFGFYKDSAGFEGWTNFETYTAYQNLCNDEHLFTKWEPLAKNLLNESVFRTYRGHMTPYESARQTLAETMHEYFKDKVDEKWTLEPINRELLKGAYDVVNWYELVDVLMEDHRGENQMVEQVAEHSISSQESNLISFPKADTSHRRGGGKKKSSEINSQKGGPSS